MACPDRSGIPAWTRESDRSLETKSSPQIETGRRRTTVSVSATRAPGSRLLEPTWPPRQTSQPCLERWTNRTPAAPGFPRCGGPSRDSAGSPRAKRIPKIRAPAYRRVRWTAVHSTSGWRDTSRDESPRTRPHHRLTRRPTTTHACATMPSGLASWRRARPHPPSSPREKIRGLSTSSRRRYPAPSTPVSSTPRPARTAATPMMPTAKTKWPTRDLASGRSLESHSPADVPQTTTHRTRPRPPAFFHAQNPGRIQITRKHSKCAAASSPREIQLAILQTTYTARHIRAGSTATTGLSKTLRSGAPRCPGSASCRPCRTATRGTTNAPAHWLRWSAKTATTPAFESPARPSSWAC